MSFTNQVIVIVPSIELDKDESIGLITLGDGGKNMSRGNKKKALTNELLDKVIAAVRYAHVQFESSFFWPAEVLFVVAVLRIDAASSKPQRLHAIRGLAFLITLAQDLALRLDQTQLQLAVLLVEAHHVELRTQM